MKRGNATQRKVSSLIAAVATGSLALLLCSSAPARDLTVTTTADGGDGSLRDAIGDSNALPGADRILFRSRMSGSIVLESDLPPFSGPVEVRGPGRDALTIDGNHANRIFTASTEMKVSGLRLQNAYTHSEFGSGAAMSIGDGGSLEASGVTFSGNEVRKPFSYPLVGGGAVAIQGGSLKLKNCRFKSNRADIGGAVFANLGDVEIRGSSFVGNSAESGGAIDLNGANLDISGTRLATNEASGGGGAIRSFGGTSHISNSVFEENSAAISEGPDGTVIGRYSHTGGAVLSDETSSRIVASLFRSNSTRYNGGGAVAISSTGKEPFTVNNSTFAGNRSGRLGGAIRSNFTDLRIDSSTITENSISNPDANGEGMGAGIDQGNRTMYLVNSVVSGNAGVDLSTHDTGAFPFGQPTIDASFSLIGKRGQANVISGVRGSNLASLDPELNRLANNGGQTQTMAPRKSSPLINKGATSLAKDQRGLVRPIVMPGIALSKAIGANGSDIGAVERQTNRFSIVKVRLRPERGVAIISIRLPGPGRILLSGKSVHRHTKKALSSGLVGLRIKARGTVLQKLRKGKEPLVRARVTFTPRNGKPRTKHKNIRLKLNPRRSDQAV